MNASSNFLFPVELYPNLLVRLRGTPARLEDAFRGRFAEILIIEAGTKNGRPRNTPGTCLISNPCGWREWATTLAASTQLTPTDLQNRKTDEANHNAQPLEAILTEFRAAREKLLTASGRDWMHLSSRARFPHPRLKTPMRLVDHLYFVAEHDDHHLARIWELLTVKR